MNTLLEIRSKSIKYRGRQIASAGHAGGLSGYPAHPPTNSLRESKLLVLLARILGFGLELRRLVAQVPS
jgi:hypothetical protein